MGLRTYTLRELARIVDGELSGDGDVSIAGASGIKEAHAGEITFITNDAYEKFLDTTRASAVIGHADIECALPSIRVEDPYLAFAKVLAVFAGDSATRYPRGIHDTAVIDDGADLGDKVSIGPYCQIGRGATVGDNSTLLLGCYVGEGVTIGRDCLIYPNVTVREKCEIGMVTW